MMSSSLALIRVSERQLIDLCQTETRVVRIGSTAEPIGRRASEYGRLGYEGEMYFADVPHMKDCEDRCLLASRLAGSGKYNFFDASIGSNGKGMVYVIVGQWLE